MIHTREIRHFHLFCGLGAGARGFNRAQARVGNLQGVFRCLGGIDDPEHELDWQDEQDQQHEQDRQHEHRRNA